jgi:integrase
MSVFNIKKVWYIDYYFEGRRIREAIGSNKKVAQQVLAIRKAEIAQGKHNIRPKVTYVTFCELANLYIVYAKANKKSWKRDVVSLNSLLPFFEKMRLEQITPLHIEKYKLKRRCIVKGATVNRDLACLKHMFNLAIKWDMATGNPVNEVKFFRVTNRRLRYLSEDEAQRLIYCCSNQLKPIVMIALFTGMRKGEILNLRWSDIDLSGGNILVQESKGGEPRQIPMNDLLKKMFIEMRSRTSGNHIFLNCHGEPYRDIRSAFSKSLKRAGISDFTFHGLRHTFASHLIMTGADLVTVKELLGHKSIQMTMRYAHLSGKHKRQYVNVLQRRIFYGQKLDIRHINEKRKVE